MARTRERGDGQRGGGQARYRSRVSRQHHVWHLVKKKRKERERERKIPLAGSDPEGSNERRVPRARECSTLPRQDGFLEYYRTVLFVYQCRNIVSLLFRCGISRNREARRDSNEIRRDTYEYTDRYAENFRPSIHPFYFKKE